MVKRLPRAYGHSESHRQSALGLRKSQIFREAARTGKKRTLCDCPEPCGCYAEGYAAGKDKAYFEIEMALQDDTHAASCGCQPCRTKRACLRKVMTLMTRNSPALFELAEAWALEDHTN